MSVQTRDWRRITPARNEEAYIEKTIRSVVFQTVRPEKWVIVSDASTDRTVGVNGRGKFKELKKLEVVMEHAAVKDYVKIPKQEYNLLKEVYRTVRRQAFLLRINEAERNLAAGKTKAMSVDDVIASV